ncbi:MAG: hypothetical protein M1838_003830 [Thelocarpon superellum]|nr:MAG: hypothetical protein M1838_003830 [Thelocarpon superellum]
MANDDIHPGAQGSRPQPQRHAANPGEEPPKRKRGRPRKHPLPVAVKETSERGASGPARPRHRDEAPLGIGPETHPRLDHSEPRPQADESANLPEIQPRGILTPIKRKRGRPKKAVSFGGHVFSESPNSLGFKDIPTDTSRSADAASRTSQSPAVSTVSPVYSPTLQGELPFRNGLQEISGHPPTPPKRKRGRPRKSPIAPIEEANLVEQQLAAELQTKHAPAEASEDAADADPRHFRARFALLAADYDLKDLVALMRDTFLEKLTGRRPMPLLGLDEEYRKLHHLVERTVVAGEGNSMLVIGARGSGKTTMVEQVIADLSIEHARDFHAIRLHGFIHTDDRLALKEIWRQLGREMNVEDDFTNNYADTLSSLLALLSHPSEFSEGDPERTATSVVFVLDEFDLFASHPRQTLLYNLFDIAQARKAPIAVVGLTTKINVVESLEKRVKSRFSHRSIHLPLPRSLASFWSICRQAITWTEADETDQSPENKAILANDHSGLREMWNEAIEELWNKDNVFRRLLHSVYHRSKSAADFYSACLIPIGSLTPPNLYLSGLDFRDARLAPPDSKLHLLAGLSELELALLIAAARLDIILDTDTCNFNMAYDEYNIIASRVKAQSSASGAAAVGAGSRIWGREVAIGAWERLAAYELLVPAIGGVVAAGAASGVGGGSGSREVARTGRMFKVDVALQEIIPSVPGMNTVVARWCREI